MNTPSEGRSSGRTFRVIEVLGRGGFGIVYRAEAVGHGGFTKQVALKVLRKDVDLSGGIAARLRDEARILGLLQHPAVVGVDGLIEVDNGWAIVMEYVPGVNVSSLVRDGCPPAAAAELVAEVAGALHAAWGEVNATTGEPLRLVHRDIKPANIRVTPKGDVKVLDFGVARADFDDREAETVSVLFGSMRYMAPERLDGIEGPASDLFALGIVFAELLAGDRFDEPPKNAKRHADWLEVVLTLATERIPISVLPEVADLLTQTLAYDEELRPTAIDFRRVCRELTHSLPGPRLRDHAEARIATLQATLATSRAKRLDDGTIDSVLVEQGSQVMRTEVTGITRTRALVGGAMAGVGALGALAILVGVALLLVGGTWWWWPESPTVSAEEFTQTQPAPRPPKVVTTPRPAPETLPEPAPPQPVEKPNPTSASPSAAPSPRRTPDPPAPAAEAANLMLTGDLSTVQLHGAKTLSLKAGSNSVAPGTYTVHAAFDPSHPIGQVAQIQVPEGKATLHCAAMLYTCRIQ